MTLPELLVTMVIGMIVSLATLLADRRHDAPHR